MDRYKSEKLAKRYLLMLETVAKAKQEKPRKDGMTEILLLRELLASLASDATARLVELVRCSLAVAAATGTASCAATLHSGSPLLARLASRLGRPSGSTGS